MIPAPLPEDELLRLACLTSYHVLDTPPEEAYDDLVKVAATVCETPIALVSLVDETRQWFKAKVGITAEATPREWAFCAHAILQHDVMVVPDASADPRFVDNPLVTTNPHIRFYAGAPLETASGHRLGTLCVIDRKPRTLTETQVDVLKRLGRQVVRQLELRLLSKELTESNADLSFIKQVVEQMDEPIYWLNPADGFRFVYVNEAAVRHYGYPREQLLQMRVTDWNPDITQEQLEANWARIKEQRSVILETRHRLQDGQVIAVEVTANYVKIGGEEYVAGTIRKIEARKQAEQREKAQHELLAAISAVQSTFIAESDISKAFQRLLEALLQLTKSEYGFIGEVLVKDDGSRYLKTHAISDIAWNEATRALYDRNAPTLEFYNLHTLFGHVIRTGEPVVSNDPLHDVRRGGLPKGHPSLNAFLGVPLFDGPRLIGMVGVANRVGGYDEAMIAYLEPFLRTSSSIIGAYRLEQRRQEAERDRNLLAYAIDHSAEGVALLDGDGRYTYMNQAHAAMYGFIVEQLIGKTWRELYEPKVVSHIEQEIFPRLVRQGHWSGELVGRKQNGESFVVDLSLTWLAERSRGGREVLSCSCRDVTDRKRADQALRLEEERLRYVMLATRDAVYDWDLDTGIVQRNEAYQQLYAPGEPVGASATWWKERIHPDDRARVLQGVDDAFKGCRSFWSDEYRFRRHDGTYASVLDRGYIRYGEDGRPVRMTGAITDITARKEAEVALRASEARLEFVANHAPVLIAHLDRNLRYLFVNEPYAALFQRKPDEIVGKNAEDILGPKGFQQVAKFMQEALQGRSVEYEVTLEGSVPGRRSMHARYAPQFGPDGVVTGFIAAIVDVTARKEMEGVRRRLAAIVEYSDDAIIGATIEGVVTSWNRGAERLFGYTAEEVLSRSITILFPPDRVRDENEILRRTVQGESVEHFETLRLRKDGRMVDVSLTLSPIKDERGSVVGVSKIARDITTRKQAEALVRLANEDLERRVAERTAELTKANMQLRQLSRELVQTQETERRRLARDLHDEIGQVLTALHINLQLMKAQTGGQAEAPLSESLLLTSQLLRQVRQLAIDLRPQLLDELGLEQALRTYVARQSERNGWQMAISTTGKGRPLSDDVSVACYRIVQESLTNAARYACATKISLEMQWTDHAIELCVTDDGVGFDTSDPAVSSHGSGLKGLDERVRLAGGRFSVRSAPKSGCTVQAWLPLSSRVEERHLKETE